MKKIYINEEACMGCGLCRVFCATEHSRSKDIIRAHKKESPAPVPRLRVERKAEIAFSLQCRQCEEPYCVYSCLTGAMQKDPATGLVNVDPEKCMGCWTCILACPHGAIVRDQGKRIVAKCDFCPGRDVPVCVANCPNEALMVVEEVDLDPAGVKGRQGSYE
jgi:carbon-monoxide dehydrogenase iron sulfur subunit